MVRRRSFLSGLAATATVSFVATAQGFAPVPLTVPSHAVGGIAEAVGGPHVRIAVDRSLDPQHIRIGDRELEVTKRILLKGKGAVRTRFLDDARNALKLAANLRDAMIEHDTAHTAHYRKQHATWSRAFGRQVLAWQAALEDSPVHGEKVRDAHGRVYLLEWAGGHVEPSASAAGPAALAKLPSDASAPTARSYAAYVEALVAALT